MQTTTYKLNVTPGGVPLTIHISQYDVGLRQYIFQPYTSEGEFTYVTGATVTLEATKPDGYAVIHECTYNQDGSITYTLQEQLAAVPGRVWSKVVIRDGADVLGTGAVVWIVDNAGVKDGAIISDSDMVGIAAIEENFKRLVGTPIAVTTAAGMTDHEKIYLYEGAEEGYVAGDWYYWDGSAWVTGGIYGDTELRTNVNNFVSKWIIGFNISSSGTVGTNSYSAFTPIFYDADNIYTYNGAAKDSANKSFFVYVHEYTDKFVWLNRHAISMSSLPATVQKVSEACKYYRFVFGRASNTGVQFVASDLDYFSMKQSELVAPMIPIQPNPVVTNTDGTINAVYSIAENYLNYAYQANNISGLVYISENDAASSSAYTPTITPIQTSGGVDQYSIQCSGFANLILKAVTLANSRYKTGTNGENIPLFWGYKVDDGSKLKDADYKDILWSFNLLKYAEQHGFAYIVNESGNNVRAGDLLFTVTPSSSNYRGVTHVAVCLSCGADGKATVAEARNTTRTSGGNEYAVGLVVNQIDLAGNTAVIYGARFPLGAVEQTAKVIYRQNPALSSTVSSGAIIGATHTIDMPQGLYTIVVRGGFTNTPVIKIRYTGTSGYVEVAPMQKSGDTYTLTIYADAPVQYVALHAPTGGTTCSGYNLFAVARGYVAPNTILENYPELEYYDEIGYYLKSGVDLNNIGIGEYIASTNTIAGSLLNCPTNMGFKMYCINRSRTTKMQIIINSNSVVYIRNSISSGWGTWYSFTGVEVAPN